MKTMCIGLLLCFLLPAFFLSDAQAATVAYWKFNEGTGQAVANSEGSSNLKLQFGWSGGVDTHDPTWDTGLRGNAMRGTLYSQSSNNAIYSKNVWYWTAEEAASLAPLSSYSVEMIINPDSYVAWGGDGPMGLINYKDQANGKIQYLLRTYTSAAGNKLIGYYSQHADGTATNVTFDVTGAGMDIAVGNWYYLAAIFNHGTNNLELIVRNMASGQMVSSNYSSKPVFGAAAVPDPLYLVGSEGTAGRCFDGLIDEVRISNAAVEENLRLYQIPEPATMALLAMGMLTMIRSRKLF